MPDVKLSVITVCLNARQTVAQAVDSVHRQIYPHVEHIIVDGGSSDGTLDALEPYRPRMAHFISEADQGIYFAMNKGIRLASGDYLGFLNSDDVYEDDHVLEDIANALAQSGADSSHGDLVYVESSDTDRVVRYWKSSDYMPGMFEAGWHPAHPTLFVRTSLLKELGGFDTRYRYHADFDLMVRLFVERKITSTYIPRVLVRMRSGGHTNRSLRNVYRGNRESYRIATQSGIASSPLWVARKIGLRIGQFFRRPPAPRRDRLPP
jgi:glycosyltransferase involved in cell wall biosynthesis